MHKINSDLELQQIKIFKKKIFINIFKDYTHTHDHTRTTRNSPEEDLFICYENRI